MSSIKISELLAFIESVRARDEKKKVKVIVDVLDEIDSLEGTVKPVLERSDALDITVKPKRQRKQKEKKPE